MQHIINAYFVDIINNKIDDRVIYFQLTNLQRLNRTVVLSNRDIAPLLYLLSQNFPTAQVKRLKSKHSSANKRNQLHILFGL